MPHKRELILKSFQQLIYNLTGNILTDFKDIKADASEKKIYRLFVNDKSYIGIYNQNLKENLAFISFTYTFIKLKFKVPEIFIISDDNLSYIEEDLGDTSLFKQIPVSESYMLMNYYKQALSDLIRFQIIPKDALDYNYCYQTKEFNCEVIRDDFEKFNVFFAGSYLKESIQNDMIQNIIDLSCKVITTADGRYFLYRDFQPRNILIKDNSLYYIDYQSGRKGPLQYDLASFLYSGSIQLSEQQRNYLIDHYMSELKKYTPYNEKEFKYYLYYFSFLRLVQILGSYAFQHQKKKDEEILKKIPKAISNLKNLKDKIEIKEVRNIIEVIIKLYEEKFCAGSGT